MTRLLRFLKIVVGLFCHKKCTTYYPTKLSPWWPDTNHCKVLHYSNARFQESPLVTEHHEVSIPPTTICTKGQSCSTTSFSRHDDVFVGLPHKKSLWRALIYCTFLGGVLPVFTNQRRFPLPNRRFFPFSFLACPNNPSHANHEKVNFDFLRFALMMHHFYTRPHRSPWNPWHPGEDARNFGTDTEIILHRLNESFFKNTVVKWHSKRARFHVSPALQHDLDEHS